MEKLLIIGMGTGNDEMLTTKAKNALETANRVLNTRESPLSEIMSELKKSEKEMTVLLVSGDSGFFSITETIIRDFSNFYDIEVMPGINSIQYLSAKIKIPYDNAALISLHGRNANIVSKVAYNEKIFALTGGDNNVREICQMLCRYGLGDVNTIVGERLSYPNERILTGTAETLKDEEFDSLSVMYIENKSAVNPHIPLNDSDFIRTADKSVPMTKEEIRWLSLQKLGIKSADIVFDIGAGTGSVSVEMARKAFNGFVYAIEVKENACTLIRENITKQGAFNIEIVHGEAPCAFENLPVPDKAFIGGSLGKMDGILEKLIALNPDIKITCTAVTLQTLNQIIEGFKKHKMINTDVICVNIAKSKEKGDYNMMIAQNPVYIITGGCRE